MLWIFLALLAPFLWAISNLVDGDLILHRLKNPTLILGVTGLFSGLPAAYLIASGTFTAPEWSILLFGVVTGVVSLFAYYPYFRALEMTHPASAILLWNLSPVLVAISAYFLLDERLSISAYIAIGLLLASVLIVEGSSASREKSKEGMSVMRWMLLASVLTAAQAIMEKKLFLETSSSTGVALISVGSFFSGFFLLLFSSQRRTFFRTFVKGGLLLTGNQLIDVAAAVSLSVAISMGPVSVVTALGGVQPLFILALAWIASRLFSKKQFQIAKAPPTVAVAISVVLTIIGLFLIGGAA